jgi:polar amino acid transport system substrate-binding protein
MMDMEEELIDQSRMKKNAKYRDIILLVIAVALILILLLNLNSIFTGKVISSNNEQQSTLEKVKERGVLRVGYAIYPPYVDKNITTGEPYGYSIDIAKEIAYQMDVKVEFIEGSWQTYITDLQNEKFDLLIGPLFSSIQRGEEIDFIEPYGYFSVVAAIVRENEDRFNSIKDLNRKGIIIAVPQGWTAHEYALKNFPNSTIKPFKEETAALALSDVVIGNSDVGLADGPSVQQYLEQNPNQPVKALFLDKPVVVAPAGIGIKKGDFVWARFLDLAIEDMRTGGTLQSLSKEYNLYSYDVKREYIEQ